MDFTDSESENEFEMCPFRSNSNALPFDPSSIENIILIISDKFDFRVILSDERATGALLITTGFAVAGGFVGKYYGGKIGAAVGGAVGGACGLGIVAISMRDLWQDIKAKLWELFDLVYDYLAGLGLDDYKQAAMFLTQHEINLTCLGKMILETASNALGKKIMSSLTAA